ncbi:protein FAM210B, mitochondrial [Pristis pectinata]|uniref:protein FAM210B, mitochondrial n=1 Tax=Pristis pectinata TaxID=685728 RepID=UPI00223CBDF0|nr:protein FAM210B, mitochondrial [Pristis pectinata]
MPPHFLLQSRQSLTLLHKCFGRGARAWGIGAAVRKGPGTARGDHNSRRARTQTPGCAATDRWPDARLGALRGLCTTVCRNGATGKEVRRSESGDDKKLNKSQQLKQVFKEYGAVGVVFHTGISLASLGIFYLAVSSGVDVTAILYKMGFNEAVVQSRMAAGTSTFVIAYAVHKVFAPVRMSITLVSVPLIVRYFRKMGLFKASPSKP